MPRLSQRANESVLAKLGGAGRWRRRFRSKRCGWRALRSVNGGGVTRRNQSLNPRNHLE